MADEMGIFRTDIHVRNIERRGRLATVSDVMVDTGSELTWVPAHVLESLGIQPEKMVGFRQADGSVVERPVGYAIIRAGEFETIDEVVFGRPGDMVLLGARTMEGMNVRVDLVQRRLVDTGPAPAAHAA